MQRSKNLSHFQDLSSMPPQAPDTAEHRHQTNNHGPSNPMRKFDTGYERPVEFVDIGNVKNRQMHYGGVPSAIRRSFYSNENVEKIQAWLQENKLGYPARESLLPFMDRTMAAYELDSANQMTVACAHNGEKGTVCKDLLAHLQKLNVSLLHRIIPVIRTEQMGYVQYRRDWEGLRPIERPHATSNKSAKNISIITNKYFHPDM